MCTYAFHFDPTADWPFVIAGNRDEVLDRPWLAPDHHWDDREGVVGGLDVAAGGTWAGINRHGVVACLLNRWDTLGPAAGKRSRGEIVLDALEFADAADAAKALADLSPHAYRGFNLIVADNRDCFWVRLVEGDGDGEGGGEGNGDAGGVRVQPIKAGTHLISHGDLDDISARRIERFSPQFQFLGPPPNPDVSADWTPWRDLLSDASLDPPDDPKSGLRVSLPEMNFGTGSQSFMALRSVDAVSAGAEHAGVYWFAKLGEKLARII